MENHNKKRVYGIIIVFVFIFFLGVFLSWIFFYQVLFGPEIGVDCKIILENPGNDKIEIVFLTNDVPEERIEEYTEFLINSEPFNKVKEKFNFYYVGEGNCSLYEGKAVLCYSKDLIQKSSVCPNDYIFVLSDEEKRIRSSAYMNVMSLNVNSNKNILLHEFGHLFSNLADEYVPSTIPWRAKNCVQNCEKFEKYGDLEGCFEGCSKGDYYRSSNQSVMRSLVTDDYGELNTQLIIKDLEKYE